MIAKKNKKADLERKRFAFFQIGLLVAGSLCLAAFEYSTATPDDRELATVSMGNTSMPETVPQDPYANQPQEQQEQQRVVNMDNLQDIDITEDDDKVGEVINTTDPDIISIDGDIDVDVYSGGDIVTDGPMEPVDWVSEMPQFPGGEDELFRFIKSNVEYPELPREMGIGGIVYIQFVVNLDGSITQVKAMNNPNDELVKESIRVVKMMPKWKPGEQAGKKVRVRYTLPFSYNSH